MTKIRTKAMVIITLMLMLIATPLVLAQTTSVVPVVSVAVLLVLITFPIESYITFAIMKHTDKMQSLYHEKWMKLRNLCFIFIYIVAMMMIAIYLYDIKNVSFFQYGGMVLILMMPVFACNTSIGETYLYDNNMYIKLKNIAHCEKTTVRAKKWRKEYFSYTITMKNNGTHNVQTSIKVMEEILDEKLLVL